MSYQVLARKWRPRNFSELVGQTHVLKTLINALENNRLHHAYLFTGTRGVGKTTIARILARCLNCEKGITATPCGQCSACREISEGRFLDLIEVDAASRTKVEDTRELLENVQYAPSRGRFKVYLIDEVHMLSTHSFNALLKTLEEPPEHVKFLLATTDPQKLPVTVLSRCLQFNLKNLSPERLVEHLQYILGQEKIPFEDGALWQLGRAAQGSVRDCLTLLDQAIGFCEGNLSTAGVSDFLGNIDQAAIVGLMDSLIAQDPKAALQQVIAMAEHSPDFAAVLQELLSWLHRVAIAQVIPDAIDNSLGDQQQVLTHARAISAETLQLYYQIALKGREDMPFALDPRSGLEMTLLRMLAFTPAALPALPHQSLPGSSGALVQASAGNTASLAGAEQKKKPLTDTLAAPETAHRPTTGAPESAARLAASPDTGSAGSGAADTVARNTGNAGVTQLTISDTAIPPARASTAYASSAGVGQSFASASEDEPDSDDDDEIPPYLDDPLYSAGFASLDTRGPGPQSEAGEAAAQTSLQDPGGNTAPAVAVSSDKTAPTHAAPDSIQAVTTASSASQWTPGEPDTRIALADMKPGRWASLFRQLELTGVTRSMAGNSLLEEVTGNLLKLTLDETQATLFNEEHRKRIEAALTDYFAVSIELQMRPGVVKGETPVALRQRLEKEYREAARYKFSHDPIVQELIRQFAAEINADSVAPLQPFHW